MERKGTEKSTHFENGINLNSAVTAVTVKHKNANLNEVQVLSGTRVKRVREREGKMRIEIRRACAKRKTNQKYMKKMKRE